MKMIYWSIFTLPNFNWSQVVSAWTQGGDGCPYGENCQFEPAPPGHAPRCALPGLTYCLHPDPYPEKVIKKLVETGAYDIRTLLSNESPDDFSMTWRVPAARYEPSSADYPYSYGPNSLPDASRVSLVDHNSFQQAFFSQKTPLHPPTAGDPYTPSDQPSFQVANFSSQSGNHGYYAGDAPGKIWGQPSDAQSQVLNYDAAHAHYNRKLLRQNPFNAGQSDYYNLPQNYFHNNHNFYPKYNLPTNGWVRHSAAGVTPNNPIEWWRYVKPNSRADITIEQSISLPHSTTVYYPNSTVAQLGRRRQRRAAHRDRSVRVQLSAADMLRLAFKQTSEAERSRPRRQAPNVMQLCQFRTQFITPRAALNNQGNWRYIVNKPNDMMQLVRAEICTSTECSGLCSVPLGYKSRCEQKYLQKRLVALQADGQNLYTDVFWIPSCCQCTIISN